MMRQCLAYLFGLLVVTLVLFQFAESKKCLKRDIIAPRENNDYECNHPVYSECCEHGDRFTCCEPNISRNLREQLQLWGLVAVMIFVGLIIYSCLARDSVLIRSETLKETVNKFGHRFRTGKDEEAGRSLEEANVSTSDRSQLTSNTADFRSPAALSRSVYDL